jgi:hypothetical protein
MRVGVAGGMASAAVTPAGIASAMPHPPPRACPSPGRNGTRAIATQKPMAALPTADLMAGAPLI